VSDSRITEADWRSIQTIILERVEGVGFISGEEAVNRGLSGPMLRAFGIQWDLLKVDFYGFCNQFDWKSNDKKKGIRQLAI
jgi:NAD(P)H-quinone oxidoreductase subunit H